MKLGLYEILRNASEQKTKSDKITYLRKNYSPALATVLSYTFDKKYKWLLPEVDPEYKKNDLPDNQNILYTELRRLYIFVEGGNPNLKQKRREELFLQLLESVDAEDSILLLSMKNRKLPFKNLTEALIKEAFPDLFLQVKAE